MSGAVARRANSMSKALGGRATFYYALVREFVAWQNTEVTVTFDGGERRGRMHDVIVANGQWHGGGMKLAPDAHPDDGLFDVVLIGDVTKLDFVTTSPKLYSGGHVRHPRVEVVRSAALEVDAAVPLPLELDGEADGTTPARLRDRARRAARAGARLGGPSPAAARLAGSCGLAAAQELLARLVVERLAVAGSCSRWCCVRSRQASPSASSRSSIAVRRSSIDSSPFTSRSPRSLSCIAP